MHLIFWIDPVVLSLPKQATLPLCKCLESPSCSFVIVLLICDHPAHLQPCELLLSVAPVSFSKVRLSQTECAGRKTVFKIIPPVPNALKFPPGPLLLFFVFCFPSLLFVGIFNWSEIIGGGKSSSRAAFKVTGASWSGWDPPAAVEQTERMSPRRPLCPRQHPSPRTVFSSKSRIWRLRSKCLHTVIELHKHETFTFTEFEVSIF